MLQTVWHISCQEPCIGVGQIVVNCVTFWDRTIVLQRVDVVVGCANTQAGFQQAGCNELQCWRNNQFARLSSDQQTTFISPSSDLNNSVFQRCFVQVDCNAWAVVVHATVDEWVTNTSAGRVHTEQRHTVTTQVRATETVVQDGSSFNLLGVGHGACQRLGVTSRQAVVQVVFNSFFSDGEAQGDGLVAVTGSERFLRIVISNGRTFVLDRSSAESGQLGFFFKATLRFLCFVDFFVLFAVACVLHTEQSVQTGKQFFEQLCA